MQLEPYDSKDGRKVWLSEFETERLTEYYADDPQKKLAVELALCGLRGDEITRVEFGHIRQLSTEQEAHKLTVPSGKTGHRETPIGNDTVNTARIYRNAAGVRKDEPLVDVSTKTIRRWVARAGDDLASKYNDKSGWQYLTTHDLRRTWATSTYYRLNSSPVALDLVMSWGGWEDESVFRSNYLGKEPDELAVQLMNQAGMRE